jgi:hypothetical protein
MSDYSKELVNRYTAEDDPRLDTFRVLRKQSVIETASFRQYCETLALSVLYLGMCNSHRAIRDQEFSNFFTNNKLPLSRIITPSIVIHNLHGLPSTKSRLHRALYRHYGVQTSDGNLDKILKKGITNNVLLKRQGVDHNEDGIKDKRTTHYVLNHEKIVGWLDFLRAVTHMSTGLYYREGSHMIWTQDEHLALMSFANYVIDIDTWQNWLKYEAKVEHDAYRGDNPDLSGEHDRFGVATAYWETTAVQMKKRFDKK